MVTGPVFGEATPPLLRATYDYVDQVLRSNITFWKLGEPVLEVDARVPFDLALASRERRRLPGELEIRATADSADLSLMEAFTPSIRSTTGTMSLDLGVTGSWETPRLEGFFAVNEGRTTIPVLGVRYGPIQGRAVFVGDSMVIEDRITMASDEGELAIDGSIRFESLTRTALNLELTSRRFLAINDPGFMVVRPSGTVQLTGSLTRPVMSGNTVSITESDIYFADLLNKNIINLEDPMYSRYVDLEKLRRMRLGASFQSRFLDSLRINNLRVVVGPDVWLRSADAEIQLEGEAQVTKTGPEYVVAGELTTPRGEYTLNLGNVVKKKFIIERGTVRYLGTSDLNAELNIQASHRVRALDGTEIPVQATITGTILVPRVVLSSPGRTDLPERDLLAYLVFGRSEAQLAGSSARETGAGLAMQNALTLFSSELERSVVQETGTGIDLFEIRPGFLPGDPATSKFTRVAVGAQLGNNWFVTATAGFCGAGEQRGITARNFGASVDYRISRQWRMQVSAEPVQSCSRLSEFSNIARRYQLGGDILWEREY
jgi:translocation and assembly module TamB